MTRRVVVVGVGNPDRGDDAAGQAVAAVLESEARAGVDIILCSGEAARLLDACEKADAVFFVDACVSGAPAGTVHRLDARAELPAQTSFGLSSHGFGLAEAVALGKALDALPPVCVIYAIEAACFDPGAVLSEAVARGVTEAAARLGAEILALQRGP